MSNDITQTGPLNWKELQEANPFPTEAQMKEHLERASRHPNSSYNPQRLLEDMAATPRLSAEQYNAIAGYTGYGESRYDYAFNPSNLWMATPEGLQDLRADQQSGLAKLGQGFTRMITTAVTTFADDVLGTLYGLGEALFKGISNGEWGEKAIYQGVDGKQYTSDEVDFVDGMIIDKNTGEPTGRGEKVSSYNQFMSNFINNDVSKGLQAFNLQMQEWMPTYTSSEYQQNQEEGRWWKNLGDATWWGSAIENTGFMIGTAASVYLTGGGGLAKKGTTTAARQIFKKAAKEGLDNAASATAKAALGNLDDIANVGETIAKNGTKLHWGNLSRELSSSTIAALGEARLESLNAGDNIAAKAQLVEQNYQVMMQNAEDEVAIEHPEWFSMIESDGKFFRVPNDEALAAIDTKKTAYTQQREDALALIGNQALAASNHVFGWNVAVLTASNFLAFNQFVSPGSKFMKQNTKLTKKQSWKSVEKELEAAGMDKSAIEQEITRRKALEAAGGFEGQSQRKLIENTWQTKGKHVLRGVASPLREASEEMMQNVAQQAESYRVGSSLNEFYGYTLDPEGNDHAVSYINSIAKGFNRTFCDPRNYEEGFMGALTALIPLPGMGFTVRRNKSNKHQGGLKGFTFNWNNEFYAGVFGNKENRQQAREMAEAYNNIYNGNERNMTLVNTLARAEGLNREYQNAIDSDDDYSIIGINNRRFWNVATLYNKLGRTQELYDMLDEIENMDTKQLGQEVLSQFSDEELSDVVDPSQLDPQVIGEKVKENSEDYKDKLNSFKKTQEHIYNLFGSAELGAFQDDFLTEMTFITSNIRSLENRWKNIAYKSQQRIENALRNLADATGNSETANNFRDILNKLNDNTSSEVLSNLFDLFSDKQLKTAVEAVLDETRSAKLVRPEAYLKMLDFDRMFTERRTDQLMTDLIRILAERREYINRFEKLAKNPSLFTEEAMRQLNTFQANLDKTVVDGAVENLSKIDSPEEFYRVLQLFGAKTQKSILKTLTQQGNKNAAEIFKTMNLINKASKEIYLTPTSEDYTEEDKARVAALWDIIINNAQTFDDLSIDNVQYGQVSDIMTEDEYNKALGIVGDILNKYKPQVNTAADAADVSTPYIIDEDETGEPPLDDDVEGILRDAQFAVDELEVQQSDLAAQRGTITDEERLTLDEIAEANAASAEAESTADDAGADPVVTHPDDVPTETSKPEETVVTEPQEEQAAPTELVQIPVKEIAMAIQEFDVFGDNVQTFERPIDNPRLRSFTTLYTWLKDRLHAFENVDHGMLTMQSKVYFGISPKMDNDIQSAHNLQETPFTVLLFVKDSTGVEHCVGSLNSKAAAKLELQKKLTKELGVKLNDTESDYLLSTQYTTVKQLLPGYVKAKGIDYISLNTLVQRDTNNQAMVDGVKPMIAIIRNGQLVVGEKTFTFGNEVMPTTHNFAEGSPVMLMPTMAYDRAINGINQINNKAFYPLALNSNFYTPSVTNPINTRIANYLDEFSKPHTTSEINHLVGQLKSLLLFDYTQDGSQRTVHINAMGYNTETQEYVDIMDKKDALAQAGKTVDDVTVYAIKFDVRKDGNTIESYWLNVRQPEGANAPTSEGTLQEFVNSINPKYQIDRRELGNEQYVQDLINSDTLSTNVESSDMLRDCANSFLLNDTVLQDTEVISETNAAKEEEISNQTKSSTTEIQKSSQEQQIEDDALTLDDLDDEIRMRRQDETTGENTSLDKELKQLERMLPNLTKEQRIQVVNSLINVKSKGVKAGGQFLRGIITISRFATEGTTYHEAFHAVFHLMLNDTEKTEILDEARKLWNIHDEEEIEECLAEEFREYAMTQDSYNLGKKILNFFKNLWNFVTNRNSIEPKYNKIFRDIYNGKFGDRALGETAAEREKTGNKVLDQIKADINKAWKSMNNKQGMPIGSALVKEPIGEKNGRLYVSQGSYGDKGQNSVGATRVKIALENWIARNPEYQGKLDFRKFIDTTGGVSYEVILSDQAYFDSQFNIDGTVKPMNRTTESSNNPTTLPNEVYAKLTPLEKERAQKCHSK